MTARRKDRAGDEELGIRPLTARSVLLSTLLGADVEELPAHRLVATARLFGIGEGAARVALSRMAAAGDVAATDGRYRLGTRLAARQRLQRADRRPPPDLWRGDWHLGVVVQAGRTAGARTELRRALERAHLATWREGVWLRPDNLPRPELPGELVTHVQWATARPDGDAGELAAALWDLPAWAGGATALRTRLEATRPAVERGDEEALAPGFVLSAAVLRHLGRDPLLPPALLPADWPGDDLRSIYDKWDDAYQRLLTQFQRRST